MIAAGANAKAPSTHMGHSTIGITLDRDGYRMPENESESAGTLDAHAARPAGTSEPGWCRSRAERPGSSRTPTDQIPHG